MSWVHTIKFKIVALAVATGVLSAVGTAQLLLRTTQAEIERLLLDSGAANQQSNAALMANKLNLLHATLAAITRKTRPELWRDHAALSRYLEDKPAAHALFDIVIAADASGKVVVRLVRGKPTTDLPEIADRPYFQKAMQTDQIVMSEPIVGRASKTPLVLLAMAAPPRDGQATGIIAGSLSLGSTSLLSDLGQGDSRDGSRTIVMDRSGLLLAHPDPERVMGKAADEPGLSEVFKRWRDSGSPIDTDGSATLSGDYLISMAGIAVSDWVLVRMTPKSIALQPLRAAQRTAWLSAAGVGLSAALLAGLVGWFLTRPITRLRARADAVLRADSGPAGPWPTDSGELGDLARAFQQVEEQRERRQGETQALLQQLEAVMDHARVGIALTRNGNFELVSRHFSETFGREKSEMEGQSTRIIYASDDAYAALAARAHPQFMEQGFFDGEVELMRKSGEIFWAHMRGRAVVPGDRSQGTIWTFEDVTDVRSQREKLTWNSSHDALTGLANRPAFDTLLVDTTALAATTPFCALFIDLDHFKQVNDTGGHAAGDAVLRDIAKALVSQVRKSDTVARLGGDEFAIVLSECPLDHARTIAEKIRVAVVDYRLEWEGNTFSVGASIGLVRVDAGFETAKDVLAAADSACYAAKHRGRNCVVTYGD